MTLLLTISLQCFFVVFVSLSGLTIATQHVPIAAQRLLRLETGETTHWPSLKWNFKLKQKSKRVYGKSRFSVFSNPVVSSEDSSVYYDTITTFKQGNAVVTCTFVDGVARLETKHQNGGDVASVVQCSSSEFDDFPSINSIVAAINHAKPVSRFSTTASNDIKCENDDLFKISLNSYEFALCVANSSQFELYGDDLDIVVEYLDDPVDITQPDLTGSTSDDRTSEVSTTKLTSFGKYLLSRETPAREESRSWKTALANLFGEKPACSCKSIPRPCIFVHGLGVKEVKPANEDSLWYWGNITDHAPCCSSTKFAHLNTVNNTWTSKTQQENVCDRVLAVSSTNKDSTIRDTIVVTHSMGGLMLAGAIANGECRLDSSSTWVSMAAPMRGSMSSDYVQEACAGKTNFIAEELVELHHECPINQAIKSLAYDDGDYSSMKLNVAYELAQNVYRTNVSAVMCSESYSGIFSTYQAYFWVLGHFVPHKSTQNDGVVEFQSCSTGLDLAKFGDTYNHRFYRTKLNHYDMQFRAGDSLFNMAKMPVKWFECLL